VRGRGDAGVDRAEVAQDVVRDQTADDVLEKQAEERKWESMEKD
jgi:hypothetical protein